MTRSKEIVPNSDNQKPFTIEQQKPDTSEKKTHRVEVPSRMKSTYDPVNRKSEYKMANGGNHSEPGKRDNKAETKQVQEPELSYQSGSEANKYDKQQYEKAVMAGLDNIQKDIAFISANTSKNHEQVPHRRE